MDGDASHQALQRGASAGLKDTELSQGIHEDVKTDMDRGSLLSNNRPGEKTADTNQGPNVFDAKGAIGGAFTKDGAIGGAAEKVGGPLSSGGVIGKNFNADGAIGGSVQKALGGEKK